MKNKIIYLPLAILLFISCAGMPGPDDYGDPMEKVALYSVEQGRLNAQQLEGEEYLSLSQGSDSLHREIWERSMEIIPDRYEPFIKHFRISSDGIENIMAYVEAAEGEEEWDLSSWTLAVDILDVVDHMGEFKSEDLDETLIHEFAHILSFNSDQADPASLSDDEDMTWIDEWDYSDKYRTYDAISKKDSYLNIFFQEFWREEQLREWLEADMESETEDDYYMAINRLSIKYHTDFVSDYALTNPDEDFAESFTRFVLNDKPEGSLISHKKIRFFYRFPELVEIRDSIRSVLPGESEA